MKLAQLREHNTRARELVEGLTDTAGRNVRNLQEAVGLIGEIRETNPIGNEVSDGIGSSSRFWKTFTLIAVPAAALLSPPRKRVLGWCGP
jgi:hypothetical protein